MIKYKNPFYCLKWDNSSPEYEGKDYQEYRGFLIVERIKGRVWDVVKNDTLISMRAGLNGAKSFIDNYNTMLDVKL